MSVENKPKNGFYNGKRNILGILGLDVENIESVKITDPTKPTFQLHFKEQQIGDFAEMINECEIFDMQARPTAIITKMIKVNTSVSYTHLTLPTKA